jgi:hypothetical protein
VVGWISNTLIFWDSDISVLPLFTNDGAPVVPFTPTPIPPPTDTPGPGTPTAGPTPTPRGTPEARQPATTNLVRRGEVPAPEGDEMVVTVVGEPMLGDPREPLAVIGSSGRNMQLLAQSAEVQLWSGLFGEAQSYWLPAPAGLLWRGSTLYVTTTSDSGQAEGTIDASRIRIVQAPRHERAEVLRFPSLNDGGRSRGAMALIGSREEAGMFMLESTGTLQQILLEEQDAKWVSPNDLDGVLLRAPNAWTGRNSFTWMRNDGTGLQIFTQPFHNLAGVAGDVDGTVWWIETPQANLDQWQLWRYDPFDALIELRLRADSKLLREAIGTDRPMTPQLVAVEPAFDDAAQSRERNSLSLLVDTSSLVEQTPHHGLVRIQIDDASVGPQASAQSVELLLSEGNYRSPLALSPDGMRLAFLLFDAALTSLTSGFITPPNRVNLLTLTGPDAGRIQVAYQANSPFEFLAPTLSWRGNSRLVVARSRFAGERADGLDQFGLVQISFSPEEVSDGTLETSTWLFEGGERLLDFTTCRNDDYVLLLVRSEEDVVEVTRWGGAGQPRPLLGLPVMLNRTFSCWQAPVPQYE